MRLSVKIEKYIRAINESNKPSRLHVEVARLQLGHRKSGIKTYQILLVHAHLGDVQHENSSKVFGDFDVIRSA